MPEAKQKNGIEELAERVWGDKVFLGLVTSTVGGIGLGLLASRRSKYRPLAIGMMLFSMASKMHAIATAKLGPKEEEGQPKP